MKVMTVYKRDNGFTLVELMVIIVTIGVLASIAIAQVAQHKGKGYDTMAKTDLLNVAAAEESYFVRNEVYKSCTESTCPTYFTGIVALSNGTSITMTATPTGFTGLASHNLGTKTFSWDSSLGGLQ